MNYNSHLNHLNKKQLLEIYEGLSPYARCSHKATGEKINF
jgi:hypothetical protein